MKSFFLALALCAATAVSASAQIQSASLKADGLTCSMCSKAIYKALLKVPSVQSVTPDIEGSTYTIAFKPGVPVSPDALAKAVTGAGFSVGKLQLTARFAGVPVEADTHLPYDGAVYHFVAIPKSTLSGERTFTVVDKGFLPTAERKKYAGATTMACFETGTLQPCCAKNVGAAAGTRVYHVTL